MPALVAGQASLKSSDLPAPIRAAGTARAHVVSATPTANRFCLFVFFRFICSIDVSVS